MTELPTIVSRTDEPVARLYKLVARLGDSPNTTLYVGRLRTQMEARLVLVGKTSFPSSGEEGQHFVERVSRLRSFFARNPGAGELLRAEIDSEGIPFMEFSRVVGNPYPMIRRSHAEADRRFLSLIRAVSAFHAEGIWFGDLTPTSFLVNSSLDPVLVGLMGLTGPMVLTSDLLEQVVYLAPEVRRGQPSSAASDVYSLCVIGATLFGMTFETREVIRAVEVRERLGREAAPDWLCNIVLQGLAPYPGDRPADAGQLLAATKDAREAGVSKALVLRKDSPSNGTSLLSQTVPEPNKFTMVSSAQPPKHRNGMGKLVFGSAIVAAIVVALAFYRRGITTISTGDGTVDQAMELLRQADFSPKMTPAERARFFERLRQTADPTVHDAVILVMERAQSLEERLLAEQWLLERCNRLGMHRSVAIVRRWFGDKPLIRPPSFMAALRALDRTAPQPAHEQTLKEIHSVDRGVAIQLAVALLMDWGGREVDRQVISQLVAGVADDRDMLERPVTAIILALPETRQSFPDDTREGLRSLGGEDLLWLLARMVGEQDEEAISRVASAGLLSPELNERQRRLLALGVSGDKVPLEIRKAVIRLVGGTFIKGDIDALAAWRDVRAGRILLLLTQIQQNDRALRSMLGSLFTKPVESEPAQSMLAVLSRSAEDDIRAAGRAPGYFYEITAQGRLPDAVDANVVGALGAIPGLVKAVMSSTCEPCQEVLLDTIPDKLSPTMLFRLLRAESKVLRIKSLRRLSRYDNVGAINLLRMNYEWENEESVREVYRTSFPVIFGTEKTTVSP